MKANITLTAIILLTPTFSSAASCPSWVRTLKVGSHGSDVRSLQIFLNSKPLTRVTQSGAGSPGFESLNYGPATARAIAKFQETHNISATGVFGPVTRVSIVNEICGANDEAPKTQTTFTPPLIKPTTPITRPPVTATMSTPATAPAPQKKPAAKPISLDDIDPAMRKAMEDSSALMSQMGTPLGDIGNLDKKLILGDPSPRATLAGTEVAITGNGFGDGATIILNGRTIPLSILNSTQGTFKLPSDIKPGLYDISVRVNGNTSNTARIAIMESGKPAPSIKNLDPSSGNNGTTFTITGTNFADVNDVDTTGGTITNISSDGNVLRFTLSVDSNLLFNGKLMTGSPFFIGVRNKYGSSDFVRLTLN